MSGKYKRIISILDSPLTTRSRILIVTAALVLIPTFFAPLWRMSFLSQQYPEGLDLYIYSHSLVGGDHGNDLVEINVLNHYIGMAELKEEDFSELKWIPLVIGLIGILTFRAAAIGSLKSILDIVVICIYFAGFSLWSFWYKMNYYGKHLDPRAAVNVDPFTPPVFGYKMVGQFEVWSYPALATYLFVIFGLLLLGGFFFTWRTAGEEMLEPVETGNGGKQ